MPHNIETSRPVAAVGASPATGVGRVPPPGPEMSLLSLDESVLHRCCHAVGSLATVREDEPGAWLECACRAICGLDPGAIAAQALVAQSSPTRSGWKARYVAVAGAPSERTHEHASAEAAECWPFDDVTPLAAWRPAGPAPALYSRDERVALERWLASDFRKHRAQMGLHEYLRVLIPYRDSTADALFALQIDGLSADWRPDATLREAAAGVAPFVFRAFFTRFEARDLERSRLLDRLSPAQAALPPMLAAGLTEGEVAQQLGRSRHTVHEWIRGVYKAWGINSRFQLREIWMGRGSASPASSRSDGDDEETDNGDGPDTTERNDRSLPDPGATYIGRAADARASRRGPP